MAKIYKNDSKIIRGRYEVPIRLQKVCDKSCLPLPGSIEITSIVSEDGKQAVCQMCPSTTDIKEVMLWLKEFDTYTKLGQFCPDCLKYLGEVLSNNVQ